MPTAPSGAGTTEAVATTDEVVAIVGSRDYPTALLPLIGMFVAALAERASARAISCTIISGEARGVDREARDAAARHGLPYRPYEPNYPRHGPFLAPILRNTDIAEACTHLMAFWDWESYGTLDVVDKALARKKVVSVIGPDGVERPLDAVRTRIAELRTLREARRRSRATT